MKYGEFQVPDVFSILWNKSLVNNLQNSVYFLHKILCNVKVAYFVNII